MVGAVTILVVGVWFWWRVVSSRSHRNGGEVVRLGEKIWLTPGKIVDLGKQELEPWQEAHNARLDFEIAEAEREFQHRERVSKELQEAFLRANPDWGKTGFKSLPYVNVIGRRKVFGIRYEA